MNNSIGNNQPTGTAEYKEDEEVRNSREVFWAAFQQIFETITKEDLHYKGLPALELVQTCLPPDELINRCFGSKSLELKLGKESVLMVYTGFTAKQISTEGMIDRGFIDLNNSLNILGKNQPKVVIYGNYSLGGLPDFEALMDMGRYRKQSNEFLSRPNLLIEFVDVFSSFARPLQIMANSLLGLVHNKLIFTSFNFGFDKDELLNIMQAIYIQLQKEH